MDKKSIEQPTDAETALVRDEQKRKVRALVESKRKAEQKIKPLKLALILAGILVVVGFAIAIISVSRAQYLASPEGIAAQQQKRVDELVKKVGKLTGLPDEKPLATTITNVEKLQSQTFFANAENGDEVLVFENSGRAIIYREKLNRIINDGPLVDTVIE
jgi:hypothetical protein